MCNEELKKLIRKIPKAECHRHVEGGIPWHLVPIFAERNGIKMPFSDMEGALKYKDDVLAPRNPNPLNTFLDMLRVISQVLVTKEDYRDLMLSIAEECVAQNIIYQELMFVYSFSEDRGIPLDTVLGGYREGIRQAKEKWGIEIFLIANIDKSIRPLRSLHFVEQLKYHRDIVVGIGADCEPLENPNIIHVEAFQKAKKYGFLRTCHSGEIEEADDMWNAIRNYQVQRFDHGVKALNDPKLIEYLRDNDIMLTLCPTSNIMIGIFDNLKQFPAKTFMEAGVPITINCDNPPWLDVNLSDELEHIVSANDLSEEEVIQIIKNAFKYSAKGENLLHRVEEYLENNT